MEICYDHIIYEKISKYIQIQNFYEGVDTCKETLERIWPKHLIISLICNILDNLQSIFYIQENKIKYVNEK